MARTVAIGSPDDPIVAGDEQDIVITILAADGSPLNLTGVQSIVFRVATPYDRKTLVTKQLGSGIAILDAANGRIRVNLTEDDTDKLSGGVFYHETKITDAGSVTFTPLKGNLYAHGRVR
jgi:hypothetical protein